MLLLVLYYSVWILYWLLISLHNPLLYYLRGRFLATWATISCPSPQAHGQDNFLLVAILVAHVTAIPLLLMIDGCSLSPRNQPWPLNNFFTFLPGRVCGKDTTVDRCCLFGGRSSTSLCRRLTIIIFLMSSTLFCRRLAITIIGSHSTRTPRPPLRMLT
jgi:hypothetical protein